MKLHRILSLLPLVAVGFSFLAVTPTADARWNRSNEPTIVDIASGNAVNFSILTTALVKADLVKVLDGHWKFTVFAPTNDAFDAAAAALLGEGSTGEQLIDALDKDSLKQILLYHVVWGEKFSPEVLAAGSLRTLSWKYIDINGTTLEGIGTSANLVLDPPGLIDIEARNGVIHVIDFVLLPFAP